MARHVVYEPSRALVPPEAITGPEGVDGAALLAGLVTPLPFEDGYVRGRWRTFRTLSGEFTFTFPTSPLLVPAGYSQGPDVLFVFVDARGGVLDRITAPAGAELAIRNLYGTPHPAHPRSRAATVVMPFLDSTAPSVTLTFAGVRVAGVRATFQAWT